MNSFTDTHPSMDACPPLEDIAAFLDGMLPSEDRERITAHLADCERCYEIFAGAAHFLGEKPSAGDTGEVVPLFPLSREQDPAPGRIPRWLLLAASLVLAAGMGYFAWQASRPPEITLAGVVDTVEDRSAAAEQLYKGKVYRNLPPPSPQEAAEFMTGVYLVDLRLSGTPEATQGLLQNVGTELKEVPGLEDLGQRYAEEYVNFRASDGQRASRLQTLEAEVQEAMGEFPSFSFGLWAEAGRLAATTESSEFFERRNNRRYLSQLLKEESLPVPRELVFEDLKNIETFWDKDDLSEENFKALATHFQNIIRAVDDSEDELLDPLYDEEPPSLPEG